MNFDIICSNCGASSSPTVGVCPYCKSVMTTEDDKQHPSISKIRTLFNDGKIDQALSLANNLAVQKPESLKSTNFVLSYMR
jgi:predicted ATP-dependent serine protease